MKLYLLLILLSFSFCGFRFSYVLGGIETWDDHNIENAITLGYEHQIKKFDKQLLNLNVGVELMYPVCDVFNDGDCEYSGYSWHTIYTSIDREINNEFDLWFRLGYGFYLDDEELHSSKDPYGGLAYGLGFKYSINSQIGLVVGFLGNVFGYEQWDDDYEYLRYNIGIDYSLK